LRLRAGGGPGEPGADLIDPGQTQPERHHEHARAEHE
jgi:hypothetical protein